MSIDIGTGAVELLREDFTIPGRVPIKWTRHYNSKLVNNIESPLSRGWTSSWFPGLRRETDGFVFNGTDGTADKFFDPPQRLKEGTIIRLLGAYLELSLTGKTYTVTEWSDELGPIQRYIFSQENEFSDFRLISVENLIGEGVDVLHNSSGNLISLRQRIENRKLSLNYNAEGLISAVCFEDKAGARHALVRYEYDLLGRLSSAIDPRGLSDRYEYDDLFRLKREILKDGAVYTYRYDEKSRCIYFGGLDGYNEKKLKFVDSANRTIVTNSLGNTSVFEHLASGQIINEYDELGNKRSTVFDEYGRIISKIDANGGATKYTFDHNGNRDSITDPLGNTVRYIFDSRHQVVKLTDQNGFAWVRYFDSLNRLVGFQNPLGARWTIEYDAFGNAVALINPLGNVRKREFSNGLIVAETDCMGHLTRFKWNEYGQVVEKVGPLGERTIVNYDIQNKPIRVTLPDGQRLDITYDAAHNISSATNSKGRITKFRYGSCRRLLECIDSIGRSVRFAWSTEPDRLNVVVNEKGEQFIYLRDPRGYVVKETSYDGHDRLFEYDANGQCTAFINAAGERILFSRDLCGRLEKQTLPDGAATEFVYDPIGRIISASNSDSVVTFEYDEAGRLVREIQGEQWVSTKYNSVGNIVQTTTSLDHSVAYALDPNGRVQRFSIVNQTVFFGRDAAGQEVSRQMPGRIALRQRFDPAGRLVEQHLGRTLVSSQREATESSFPKILPGYSVLKRNFSYDGDGLLIATDEGYLGLSEYNYDPVERVVQSLHSQATTEFFAYDTTDNIAALKEDGKEDLRVYSSGDRIVASADVTYKHDAEGRLVSKACTVNGSLEQWEYQWDAVGQLRKLKNPDGEIWHYKYDSFGRRIKKSGPGSDCVYIWDRNFLIQEVRAGGKTTAWIHTKESFVPLAQVSDGCLYNIITDSLGTPRELVNAAGEVTWAARWSTWGEQIQSRRAPATPECLIRFQGQYFDEESGLHYNRFRYYDPRAGRFLTSDPIRLQGGVNLYQYAHNPLKWIDPLGLAGDPANATHITYEGVKDGKPYIGYASMPGLGHTPEEVLKYRYPNTDHFDIAPTPFYVGDGQAGKNTARGLEQRVFEDRGGLAGTSNKQNPVGESNPKRDAYLKAADKQRKKEKEKAACKD